jgi:hypothetical protein
MDFGTSDGKVKPDCSVLGTKKGLLFESSPFTRSSRLDCFSYYFFFFFAAFFFGAFFILFLLKFWWVASTYGGQP